MTFSLTEIELLDMKKRAAEERLALVGIMLEALRAYARKHGNEQLGAALHKHNRVKRDGENAP